MRFELEKLRLKRETNHFVCEGSEANQVGSSHDVFGGASSPDLLHFIDQKDDLDSYLLQFEKYATAANWPQTN